jgi:2'-5' RNA ligase
VRLFLAAELDRSAREQCRALVSGFRRSLGDAASALRWTPPENVHVTLHFLGEVDRASADRLISTLGPSLPHASFDAATSSFGAFPPGGPPKVVWLGIDAGASELARVHDLLADRLRLAGFQPEARAFSAHLTIARVRDRDRSSVRGLRMQIAAVSSHPIAWRVDHVTLFRSDLSGDAPRYESVATLPLSGSTS